MLGNRKVRVEEIAPRRALRDDVRRELWDRRRLAALREQIDEARRAWKVYPETLRQVLDAALRLDGHPGLEPALGDLAGRGALLRSVPPAWGEACARSLHDAKGRLLTLVFDPADARDRRDVAQIHLNHPLLLRALASFRKNLFALGLSARESLNRVTYRVVPDGMLPGPLLVADVRLLAVGQWGQKLHEEIRSLPFRIAGGAPADGEVAGHDASGAPRRRASARDAGEEGEPVSRLFPADDVALHLLPDQVDFPSIPQALGLRLRLIVDRHRDTLRAAVEDLREAERTGIERSLRQRAEAEAGQVREMIQTRITEIRKRIKDIDKQIAVLTGAGPDQLRLGFAADWEAEEVEQFREDYERLKLRLAQLEEERTKQPEQIRHRYRLRTLRAFPLGLRFVLPRGSVQSGLL